MKKRNGKKSVQSENLESTWNYPLLEAIMNRRSRRFGLGMEIKDGPNAFKSSQKPYPLSELEEAILLVSGAGISGFNLSDMPLGNPRPQQAGLLKNWIGMCTKMTGQVGRTASTPFGSNATQLFYTNDSGLHFLDLRNPGTQRMREFESKKEHIKIIDFVRAHSKTLDHKRLDMPREKMVPNNKWNINMPGTTVFIPVVDMTGELINRILFRADCGTYIVDDRNDYRPCISERWIREGYVKNQVTLSSTEQTSMLNSATEPSFICHNMMLACEAVGLGGLIWGGIDHQTVLGETSQSKGLGFRFEGNLEDKRERLRPVGLDGVFESFRPPYFPNMSKAVDAIIEKKFGPNGMFNSSHHNPNPYISSSSLFKTAPRTAEKTIEICKETCKYIWETYGRFPARISPMLLSLYAQAHHLDLEFYDRYYRLGAYTDTHRNHMKNWHSEN